MAFGRRELSEWAEAERVVIEVASEDLHLFSPISSSIPEVETERDLQVLRTLFANGTVFGGAEAAGWGVKYVSEYHMTQARKAGQYLPADRALVRKRGPLGARALEVRRESIRCLLHRKDGCPIRLRVSAVGVRTRGQVDVEAPRLFGEGLVPRVRGASRYNSAPMAGRDTSGVS